MSSTGRGAERRAGDQYNTPDDLAEWIVKRFGTTKTGGAIETVLDPGSGGGAFTRAFGKILPAALRVAVEIDTSLAGDERIDTIYLQQDYLDEELPIADGKSFDLIVGNPPYSNAMEFIERSLELLKADGRLVFLLRLSYLESKQRFKWWQNHMPSSVTVLSERPSFVGGATDSTAYAIFVWDYGQQACTGVSELYVESWRG